MQSSVGAQQQKVAVFDFDGTSIDGQSGSLFTRYLFSHGMMSPARLARLAWWGIRYKLHLPFRQDEAREVVFGALRGRKPAARKNGKHYKAHRQCGEKRDEFISFLYHTSFPSASSNTATSCNIL